MLESLISLTNSFQGETLSWLEIITTAAISLAVLYLGDRLRRPRLRLHSAESKSLDSKTEPRKVLRVSVTNRPLSYLFSLRFWKGKAAVNCEGRLELNDVEYRWQHQDHSHTSNGSFVRDLIWDGDFTPHNYQIMNSLGFGVFDFKLISIPNKALSSILKQKTIAPGRKEYIRVAEKFSGREYYYLVSAEGYTKLQKTEFSESERTDKLTPGPKTTLAELHSLETDTGEKKINQFGRRMIEESAVLKITLTDSSGQSYTDYFMIHNEEGLEGFSLDKLSFHQKLIYKIQRVIS
jgi:hypothetical protein